MYAVFWIFLGFLIWMVPYFILMRHIQNIHKLLLDKINHLESQIQQPTDTMTTPPIKNRLTTKSSSLNNEANAGLIPSISEYYAAQNQEDGKTSRPTTQGIALLEPDERSISVITSVWATLYGWFSGGNSIVRVGVLILLIGMVLLLRLLHETVNMPIEVWLGTIVLAALALTSLGLRLRHSRRGYALSLQGTGLAILYLTLFSAYYLYAIIPSQPTFLLLAILASVTALLSLRQDALPLAVLGFGGAFLAPILTSTEHGQVVLLFSYYLLLNIAVAWIAHQRTWKVLNLLGAVTTFGMASVWGWQSLDTSIRWPLECLLIAHVVLYVFIVVRYSQLLAKPTMTSLAQQPTASIISIDSGLLFGVPLVAFGLQAGLLQDVPYALAISSMALSILYLGLAYWLKNQKLALPLLWEGLLALGLGFLALVLPLALNAQWTSTGWLVQGVALVWVGTRQARIWQISFGVGLQLISLLLLGWLWLTNTYQSLWLELFIAVTTLLLSAALLRKPIQTDATGVTISTSAPLRLGSLLLIIVSGMVGVCLLQDRWSAIALLQTWTLPTISTQIILDLLLLNTLGLIVSTRILWQEMRVVLQRFSLMIGGLLIWMIFWFDIAGQSLNQMALLAASVAWLSMQLLIWHHLVQRDTHCSLRSDQAVGLGMLLLLLSLWSVEFYPNAAAVVLLPILLMLSSTHYHARLPNWLQLQRSLQDLYPIIAFSFGVWALWANLSSSGQFWPLPYFPLLSLLDGCLIAVIFWLYRSMPSSQAIQRLQAGKFALGGLAFWSLSGMVVRSLHQWLETPLWPEAWSSDTVQTSLTIVWSSTALLITMLASRQAWRALWWIGLGLLAMVIAKLLLVDLSNLSAMARVISFIGAGGVMLVIGYVAPLPPDITPPTTQRPSTNE